MSARSPEEAETFYLYFCFILINEAGVNVCFVPSCGDALIAFRWSLRTLDSETTPVITGEGWTAPAGGGGEEPGGGGGEESAFLCRNLQPSSAFTALSAAFSLFFIFLLCKSTSKTVYKYKVLPSTRVQQRLLVSAELKETFQVAETFNVS